MNVVEALNLLNEIVCMGLLITANFFQYSKMALSGTDCACILDAIVQRNIDVFSVHIRYITSEDFMHKR